MTRVSLIAITFASILAATGPASAIELGGTSWRATNDECQIVAILFLTDGTANIYDGVTEDGEAAHWVVDGTDLTLDYDYWYGGIKGTIFDEKRIEGTETWRNEKTQTVHNDPCVFGLE